MMQGVAAAETTPGAPRVAIDPLDTISGAYLAGRHAMVENDRSAAADYLAAALKGDPDNDQLRRRLFWALIGAGRVDEAVPMAERVAADGGDALVPVLLLASERARAGDWAAATQRLDKLPRVNVNKLLVPLVLAWVQQGAGKTDEALATLKDAGDTAGSLLLRDLHSGLVAEMAGRIELAGQLYASTRAGMQRLPLRMVEAIGGFYERNGRAAEAKPLYADYAAENPDSTIGEILLKRMAAGDKMPPILRTPLDGMAEALFHLASALQQDRSAEFGLVLARLALYLRPDLDAAKVMVASVLEEEQRYSDAVAVYQSIAKNSWFDWTARLRVAANFEAMGDAEQAERVLREMASERTDRIDALSELGALLRGKERFADAVTVYDQAIQRVGKIEPQHWALFYARGISLERSKQWQRAEADLLRALELSPNQPYVLNYLGYSWIDQGLNLDRGMDMIRKAVEQRPNDGYIVDSLGWAHFRLGNYEKAVENLERAVELRPTDPTINDHLGDAYWRVQRQLEASFQWKRALALKPDADLLQQLEKKLKSGLSAAAPGQRGG